MSGSLLCVRLQSLCPDNINLRCQAHASHAQWLDLPPRDFPVFLFCLVLHAPFRFPGSDAPTKSERASEGGGFTGKWREREREREAGRGEREEAVRESVREIQNTMRMRQCAKSLSHTLSLSLSLSHTHTRTHTMHASQSQRPQTLNPELNPMR